jgi:hypothetical protein
MIPQLTYNRFNAMMETTAFDRDYIFRFLQTDENIITEALDTALYGVHPHAWRSAWCIVHFLNSGDIKLQSRLDELLERTANAKPDGYQRELLKLISKCQLDETQYGRLADMCFNIWEQPRKQGSVRSEAFKTLMTIAQLYPDLKPEMILVFDSFADTLSHGIKHSLLRMRNQMENEIKQNKITKIC